MLLILGQVQFILQTMIESYHVWQRLVQNNVCILCAVIIPLKEIPARMLLHEIYYNIYKNA